MISLPPSIKRAAIVANGSIESLPLIKCALKPYPFLVAVDGGLSYCDKMDLTPNLIVGDFDSTPPHLLEKYRAIPMHRLERDKDETDLEVAVHLILNPSIEKLAIFGGMRKRTDHFLSNLHLLRSHPSRLFMESETETIVSLQGKNQLSCQKGQTISLIPIEGKVKGVTTRGLRWSLSNATLDTFFSLSNVAEADAFYVEIEEGQLLCIMQKLQGTSSFR